MEDVRAMAPPGTRARADGDARAQHDAAGADERLLAGPAQPGALPPPLADTPSAVPDVLAPGLECVFCGINPGRVSAAAAAHFANPRNDFWRLLHEAGFTPRLFEPSEQFSLLELGYGLTNAAYRTTKGSGDLRRGDFVEARGRLLSLAKELRPRAIAFVGKEAYRGAFNERAELGLQARSLEDTSLFVLPSTSPANAAVPYAERLRLFDELRTWLAEGVESRPAVRALVLDGERTLLFRFVNPYTGESFWTTPGGGLEPGESESDALLRELREEVGLREPRVGPCVWRRASEYPWGKRRIRQPERYFVVEARPDELAFDERFLAAEAVHEHRWLTLHELEQTEEVVYPRRLAELLRNLRDQGPPPEPFDVGP